MIAIRSEKEIEKIRRAGQVVAAVLEGIKSMVRPGVTTRELDIFAEEMIRQFGAKPAFKGYRGFPASICVEVNEVVVHGIPGERKLRDGDIVGIDVGVQLDGYFADGAATFPVGKISPIASKLIDVTRRALEAGIEKCVEGNRLSDISHAIQTTVERAGFSVVRNYVGHGIGRELHEEPQVLNFGPPNLGPRLRKGMVFAIEPMVNEGSHETCVLGDGWTVVTRDGKLSCHFEHTVGVGDSGPIVLTGSS